MAIKQNSVKSYTDHFDMSTAIHFMLYSDKFDKIKGIFHSSRQISKTALFGANRFILEFFPVLKTN